MQRPAAWAPRGIRGRLCVLGGVLLLGGCLAATPSAAPTPGPPTNPPRSSAPLAALAVVPVLAAAPFALYPPLATLLVTAQVAGIGGPPPPPGRPTGARVGDAASGATVQVVLAGVPDQVVAEQVADAQGQAQFALPAGDYWVLIPWSDRVPGRGGGPARGAYLPDGRLVHAWQEATVAAGGTVDVLLTIVVALP